MTIGERQEAIREAAEHELCETLGYWYDIKRVDIENAVGLLLGKLTGKGTVLITEDHYAGYDVGYRNWEPLVEKK